MYNQTQICIKLFFSFSPSFTNTHTHSGRHTLALPRSQSAGPDSPCRCSSAVINSLTLCVKNSNPTHSFPSLLSSSSFPLSFSQSLPSCLHPVICCLSLCLFRRHSSSSVFCYFFCLRVTFKLFSAFFSSFSVTHSLLSAQFLSSIFLSLVHSARVTSF